MTSKLKLSFILVICGLLSINLIATEVTLKVDLSNEIISPDGVNVAGSFNNWSTSDTPLVHEGNDIYSASITIAAGENIQYKFINGNTWAGEEIVPADCGVDNGQGGYNRAMLVPAQDTTAGLVCFGSCVECVPPAPDVDVTFKVDLANEEVSPDGIHIAGNFQGWDPAATLLTNTGDDVYEVTMSIQSGQEIQYKFINGDTWTGEESVPADCGIDNGQGGYNRVMFVPAQDTVAGLVCFGSCVECIPPAPDVDVTLSVDLANEEISPEGVHIVGSFQGWDPAATILNNTTDEIYEITITVPSGQEIQYKFINGNTWDDEESVPSDCGVDNGQGGYNRFMFVPTQDTAAGLVCFGSCTECPPPAPFADVTFRLDLAYEDISPDGVTISGSFNNWVAGEIFMTNTSESVFEATIQLEVGAIYEYKFINGIAWDDAEMVPDDCAQNGNRFIEVPDIDSTLSLVCFGSCEGCPPPPPQVMVSFIVDMSEQIVSDDGVHIAGSFNDWNTAATPMTNTSGSIYEAQISLTAGDNITFKYLNGIMDEDYEIVPEECGVDDGFGIFNRFYTVPETESSLDSVCFGSCVPCGSTPNLVNITFRVDMANELISEEGIHIAGNFSGWDPSANTMVNTENDIYEYTSTLNAGTYIEYKFVNGIDDAGFESVPEACAQNQNRFLTVPQTDSIMPLVCFASCDSCPTTNEVMVTFRVDMTESVLADEGVHIAGNFQGWNPAGSQMASVGNGIFEITIPLGTRTQYEYKYINGNTWAGAETVPEECALNQNRFINIGANDTTLSAVCFGSCAPCSSTADSVEVIFFVDMAKETVSGYGVHLTGSFQDWNPGSTMMNQVPGTDYYSASFRLPIGSYQEYKFINGNIWGDDEQVPEACASNGNRYFIVPETDTELPYVCFGFCEPCLVGISTNVDEQTYLGVPQPNPATGQTQISFGIAQSEDVLIELFDITGKKVQTIVNGHFSQGRNIINLSLSNLKPGVYYYHMSISGSMMIDSKKVIVY